MAKLRMASALDRIASWVTEFNTVIDNAVSGELYQKWQELYDTKLNLTLPSHREKADYDRAVFDLYDTLVCEYGLLGKGLDTLHALADIAAFAERADNYQLDDDLLAQIKALATVPSSQQTAHFLADKIKELAWFIRDAGEAPTAKTVGEALSDKLFFSLFLSLDKDNPFFKEVNGYLSFLSSDYQSPRIQEGDVGGSLFHKHLDLYQHTLSHGAENIHWLPSNRARRQMNA